IDKPIFMLLNVCFYIFHLNDFCRNSNIQKKRINIFLEIALKIRSYAYLCTHNYADMVKLVDMPDLGSGAARRVGSSPIIRTEKASEINQELFCFLAILVFKFSILLKFLN